jgi:hypothetical protein
MLFADHLNDGTLAAELETCYDIQLPVDWNKITAKGLLVFLKEAVEGKLTSLVEKQTLTGSEALLVVDDLRYLLQHSDFDPEYILLQLTKCRFDTDVFHVVFDGNWDRYFSLNPTARFNLSQHSYGLFQHEILRTVKHFIADPEMNCETKKSHPALTWIKDVPQFQLWLYSLVRQLLPTLDSAIIDALATILKLIQPSYLMFPIKIRETAKLMCVMNKNTDVILRRMLAKHGSVISGSLTQFDQADRQLLLLAYPNVKIQ